MKTPSKRFWIIASLFLLWNIFGCYIYVAEVSMTDAQYAEAYGEAKAAVRDLYPVWAVAAYALAVWSGLIAAVLFLLRRRLSPTVFVFSLIAAVVCFIPVFVSAPLRSSGGSTFWVMPAIVVLLGIIEIWYARRKRADGTLKS